MYQKESDFSKALIKQLKYRQFNVTRLESHNTSNGIPDLYIIGHGYDCWIELKNDTKQSITNDMFKIPYRPGQQAWYEAYFKGTYHKRNVVTLMSVADGVLVFRNNRLFKSNYAEPSFRFTFDEWYKTKLAVLIAAVSHNITAKTNREYIITYASIFFGDVDYDIDVLADELKVQLDQEYSKPDMNDQVLFEHLLSCSQGNV